MYIFKETGAGLCMASVGLEKKQAEKVKERTKP